MSLPDDVYDEEYKRLKRMTCRYEVRQISVSAISLHCMTHTFAPYNFLQLLFKEECTTFIPYWTFVSFWFQIRQITRHFNTIWILTCSFNLLPLWWTSSRPVLPSDMTCVVFLTSNYMETDERHSMSLFISSTCIVSIFIRLSQNNTVEKTLLHLTNTWEALQHHLISPFFDVLRLYRHL